MRRLVPAAFWAAIGCVDLGAPVPDGGLEEPEPDSAVADGPTVDVRVVGNSFDPKRLEITAGTTVRWTNYDPYAHTVTEGQRTSPNPPEWNNPYLPGGGVWEWTFGEPGGWDYYCALHTGQSGRVDVTSAPP